MNYLNLARPRIKRHESFRADPYDDRTGETVLCPPGPDGRRGVMTIGWGIAIGLGIDHGLAEIMFEYKLEEADADTRRLFHLGWDRCDDTRKSVLVCMAYQIGGTKLSRFVNLRAAVTDGDWTAARREMLDSDWARYDSPARAREEALLMLHGDALENLA